jgi:FKBP-type peptidyl-prolyl cis-trans isomerase FkpA
MKKILVMAAAVVLLASCGSNYQKTQSGLLYKIVSKGSGPQVKRGEFLKVHYSQKVNDSVVISSFDNGLPAYPRVDSVGGVYNVLEILPGMHEGDSAVVVELGDTLQKRGMLPPYMKPADKRTWTIKAVKIIKDQDAMQADLKKELDDYQAKQKKIFESFVANKPSFQKTAGGVYIDIKEQGKGMRADSGKIVSVRYKGKFMPSQKVFETNMDDPNKPPLQFPLGYREVIRGWEEGFKLLNAGAKVTMYIPYELAYGDQAGPGGIPYQNLIFDIELLDVKDAPPQNAMQPPIQPMPDTSARRR